MSYTTTTIAGRRIRQLARERARAPPSRTPTVVTLRRARERRHPDGSRRSANDRDGAVRVGEDVEAG